MAPHAKDGASRTAKRDAKGFYPQKPGERRWNREIREIRENPFLSHRWAQIGTDFFDGINTMGNGQNFQPQCKRRKRFLIWTG